MAHEKKPEKADKKRQFNMPHADKASDGFSDQAQLNQSLRQISHDLNNYMTILLINIDQLRDDLQESGAQALSEARRRQTERLKRLDLLSQTLRAASDVVHELTTPPEQAQILEDLSGEELHDLLESHLPVLQILAGEAIKITLEPFSLPSPAQDDERFMMVQLVPGFLKRCLIHMVRNSAEAIYACPLTPARTQSHHFTLTITSDEAGLALKVSDTGPGVPENLKPTLFEPGVSSEAPALSSTFGSAQRGYGMSSVAAMVTAWQGTVSLCEVERGGVQDGPNDARRGVSPYQPKKGAQFKITFPFSEEPR